MKLHLTEDDGTVIASWSIDPEQWRYVAPPDHPASTKCERFIDEHLPGAVNDADDGDVGTMASGLKLHCCFCGSEIVGSYFVHPDNNAPVCRTCKSIALEADIDEPGALGASGC